MELGDLAEVSHILTILPALPGKATSLFKWFCQLEQTTDFALKGSRKYQTVECCSSARFFIFVTFLCLSLLEK